MSKRLCTVVHFLLPFALPTRPRVPALPDAVGSASGSAYADHAADHPSDPPGASAYGEAARHGDPEGALHFGSDDALAGAPGHAAPSAPIDSARRAQAEAAAAQANANRTLDALLAALDTPALRAIIRRARLVDIDAGDDYQRSLPDARWLTRTYGLAVPGPTQDAPLAPFMLLADGVDPASSTGNDGMAAAMHWACLEPAHIEITHDRLVLAHPQTLDIDAHDAAALAAELAASAQARGLHFVAPTATRWYLGDAVDRPGSLLTGLHGASPLRAAGRSIDIWLPVDETRPDADGTPARSSRWIGFQTELQMAWHAHPVNDARMARGARPVNAIWMHGRGTWPPAASEPATSSAAPAGSGVPEAAGTAPRLRPPFRATFADAPAARGLSIASGRPAAALPTSFAAMAAALSSAPPSASDTTSDAPILIQADALSLPMIDEDWARWLDAFATLDAQWLAPALDALRARTIDEIRLTLCGEQASQTLALRRSDMLAFWRRRPFDALLR